MKAVLITSSILILLIAALRPLLRGRIDPRVQYALWLAVALRLLVPVNLVDSAYSVLALVDRVGERSQLVENIGRATVPLPTMDYQEAYDQAIREYVQEQPVKTSFTDLEEVERRTQELMERDLTLAELAERCAKPVWLGGAAMMAAWFLLVNLRLRRQLKDAEYVEADCPLPVYVSGALPSPCLCGVVRPVICVTPAALESPERLRHVLAHELTHYRHRDHWWALLRCLCLCVYWFDPLVWWAAALSRQDCELACDEGAIRRLGEEERIPYGRTLVDMIAAGRTPLLQTATTMTGGKRRVRERIKLIARKPKTVIAVALALAMIVGCAVGCTFTGAPEGGGKPLSATADSLQARLEDIPEELRADIVIRPYEQATGGDFLVHYWMNRDWTDLDGSGLGWLLGVRQMSQAEFDEYRATGGSEVFARSGDTYFAIAYATDVRYYTVEDAEPFHNAFDAIRAFAEKTVLETEGVEPYSLDENRQPLDTLQARLLDLPEELQADVAVLPPDGGSDSPTLATYVLKRPGEALNTDLYLLIVSQITQAEFEQYFYTPQQGGAWCFAKSADRYYTFFWNTSVEYEDEDAERFGNAQRAVNQFAKQTVLDTEGVESFDAEEFLSRENLQEGKTYTQVAYWPYKAINGNTDIVWIYWLVQPAGQGAGGVWVPERVQYLDEVHEVDPTPQLIPPRTGGLALAEYAEKLQAEADAAGGDFWAIDPIEVVRHFEEESGGPADIPLDSFTRDSAYIERVLKDSLPSPEEQAIRAVMEEIAYAPGTVMTLYRPGEQGVTYSVNTPPNQYWAGRLADVFPASFGWEALTEEEAIALMEQAEGTHLLIGPMSGSAANICVYQDSPLVAIRMADNEMKYCKAKDISGNWEWMGELNLSPGTFEFLRDWFDQTEQNSLRVTAVPDRGQGHDQVVREWIDGFEGALTRCTPGGEMTCTYAQGADIQADIPDWMTEEQLESFAQARGLVGAEFGKTWFGFGYSLIFVPENEYARNYMIAGNTEDYTGGGAPAGAMVFTRMGIMRLIDGNWVCEGAGTGW